MNKQTELEDLRIRLKDVIVNTCNTKGCKDCWLKFNDGSGDCSATDLEGRIMDLEIQEANV